MEVPSDPPQHYSTLCVAPLSAVSLIAAGLRWRRSSPSRERSRVVPDVACQIGHGRDGVTAKFESIATHTGPDPYWRRGCDPDAARVRPPEVVETYEP
jgi:hypothetical protein